MAEGEFAGKVVLVTGAASGIGFATAELFAQQGASVIIADISEERGRAKTKQLVDEGLDAKFVATDVTREADVENMVRTAVAEFGGLDIAVNNAGGASEIVFTLHETTVKGWDEITALNMRGPWLCMKHEILHMLDHGGGAIVNVSSMAGLRLTPYTPPAYHAAKAGLSHLTKFAAVHYAANGIRVNAIAPGITGTENVMAVMTEDQRLVAAANHPIARLVEPGEQAEAITWLCSDRASMITGLTLPVDGGWMAR
jgi:NAD(P)-dependent dehydrogenase (short-subunit alcohol dehydrogenase family)